VREHLAFLTGGVFGNPHSLNLTSLAMSRHVERTRDAVLRYFNASPDEYMVIFTPNATGGSS
jgi:molybdenum cofactor sulfurtransferase